MIGHKNLVKIVNFSYDSNFIETGSGDKTIILWNIIKILPN